MIVGSQTLVPGVQDEGEADLTAQLAAAESQQRSRRGVEQQTQSADWLRSL